MHQAHPEPRYGEWKQEVKGAKIEGEKKRVSGKREISIRVTEK